MDKIVGSSAVSVIQTLKPKNGAWREMATPRGTPLDMIESIAIRAWFHDELRFYVLSAIEFIQEGEKAGPEYHLSFSKHNNLGGVMRVTSNEAKWLLEQFGLEGSFEDNHVPDGKVRNFWRSVAEPLIGLECACQETENVIVEDRGDYVWRTAK